MLEHYGKHPSKIGSDVFRERRAWGSPPVSNKSDQDLAVAKQLNPIPTPSCLIQVEISQGGGKGEQETNKWPMSCLPMSP